MRRLQHARASVLVFLLSSGTALFPNVIFCVGDNGHRAIELVSEGCCHPQVSEGSESTEPSDHCSSKCKDVRLTAGVVLSRWGEYHLLRDGIGNIPVMALIPVPWVRGTASGTISLRARVSASDFPAGRERHTTVRLC